MKILKNISLILFVFSSTLLFGEITLPLTTFSKNLVYKGEYGGETSYRIKIPIENNDNYKYKYSLNHLTSNREGFVFYVDDPFEIMSGGKYTIYFELIREFNLSVTYKYNLVLDRYRWDEYYKEWIKVGILDIYIEVAKERTLPTEIDISLGSVTGNSATINWNGGNDENFSFFRYTYDNISRTTTNRMFTIPNLEGCKDYSKQITIKSEDRVGNSRSKTETINFKTKANYQNQISEDIDKSSVNFEPVAKESISLLPGFVFSPLQNGKRMETYISSTCIKSGIENLYDDLFFSATTIHIENDDTEKNLPNKNESERKIISLYPNPTQGEVNIEGLHPNSFIRVYDDLEKVVWHAPAKDSEITINLSDNPNGVYLLEIISNKGIEVKKIMLNK